MPRKKFSTNTILLVALLVVVSTSFVYFASTSYTGYVTHLGGQPNKLIVHYFTDISGSQYLFMSIINLAPSSQPVTVRYWNRNGEELASTNNTIQPSAVWTLASGSGGGPGGSRGLDGYLTIEASDVSSLRAQAFIFFQRSGSAVPLTISSTLYSPYGSSGATAPTLVPVSTPTSTPTTSPPSDSTLPDTILISAPRDTSISTSTSFSFTSTRTGSTFECKLDSRSFESCTSPKGYTGLTRTTHTFSVRAKDLAGNTDPTPVSYTWRII